MIGCLDLSKLKRITLWPGLYCFGMPEEERETASTRPAIMVGQARRRSGTTPAGSVLRADVFWPFTRFPERVGLSHRAAGSAGNLDRYRVVHRG